MTMRQNLIIVLWVAVALINTACFRITSTIPRQDTALVPTIRKLRQQKITSNPVVVAHFWLFAHPDNRKKPLAFLRLDRNSRYNPQVQPALSDSSGRTITVVPPGRYRALGLSPGYRPAEGGMLRLAAGDSVVIHCVFQEDPTPLY